jgi:hypothetical protein
MIPLIFFGLFILDFSRKKISAILAINSGKDESDIILSSISLIDSFRKLIE